MQKRIITLTGTERDQYGMPRPFNFYGVAWEIAEEIMKQPRSVRRMTSLLVKRPLRRLSFNDYQQHIVSEMYAYVLQGTGHEIEKLRSKFTDVKKGLEKELTEKEKGKSR